MVAQLDQDLFRMINRDWANPYFDVFFPFWTDIQKSSVFLVVMAVTVLFLCYRRRWRALFIVVSCTAGLGIADALSSKLLKPLFERARPQDAIRRAGFHGDYSFPSSHAVDIFFIAMFLSLFYPRLRAPVFIFAGLTGFSRVYCGVHYPADILGGAVVGMILGTFFFNFMERLMKTKLKFLFCLLILMLTQLSFAYEDPTAGKPFFPWVWEDQLKPTIVKGFDKTGLIIAGSGAASALVVHQYDGKVFNFSEDGGNLFINHSTAHNLGALGNGATSLLVVGAQLFWDTKNGVKTARALFLTTFSHMGISAIARRNRPENKTDFLPYPSSFPSGHTSSAFAMAGSLAYSYGWKGGIPGYLAASAIGLSRIKENRHWASDVVAGAFLGTFWARASFAADETDKEAFLVLPVPVYDGAMITAMRDF